MVDLLPRQAKVRRRVLQAVEKIVGDLRNELVQFRPQDLAAALDMEQPAIAHALYELNESNWFTYVPPFRGRAIRMLKRDGRLSNWRSTLRHWRSAKLPNTTSSTAWCGSR